MSPQVATIARVRAHLAPTVPREVPMFGAVALMVDDAMLLAVARDGGLLARVAADRDAELLAGPSAARAEMGAGRSMGVGWIRVAPEGIAADDALRGWIAAALERHQAQT